MSDMGGGVSGIGEAATEVLGLLDFSSPRSLGGGEPRYADRVYPRMSFLDVFLERALRIKGIDRFLAVVHPELLPGLQPLLARRKGIGIAALPPGDHVPMFYLHHAKIVRARKWAHQSIRGGLLDATIYDEQLPMELLKDVAAQMPCRAVVHLHPENPLLVPEYAEQALAAALGKAGGKSLPLAIRQTMLGLCPAVVTPFGLRELKRQNWLPLHVFRCNDIYDGMIGMRVHVPHNMDEDAMRGRFLLRSRRDAVRLTRLLRALGEAGRDWSVASMAAALREDGDVLLEDGPRELDVDVSTAPYPECCRLPRLEPGPEMPLDLFARICEQARAEEDWLLTIGEWGDVSAHSRAGDLRRIVAERRPYGLQVVLNAAAVQARPGEHLPWLDAGPDVVVIRLTPLCRDGAGGLDAFEPVLADMVAHLRRMGGDAPLLQLQISKHEDIWRAYHKVYDWAQQHGVDCNWAPYNDHAGQLPPHRETMSYAPMRRYACERLLYQMYILPDGTVPLCKTDFRGTVLRADAASGSLRDIWNAGDRRACRRCHLRGEHAGLCGGCRNWMHT